MPINKVTTAQIVPVTIANTEVRYFGNQLLDFYKDRHSIGASTLDGNEKWFKKLRSYDAGRPCLIHGEQSQIHGIGLLGEETFEHIKLVTVIKSWDEDQVETGNKIAIRICFRPLDPFYIFDTPIHLTADLGWTNNVKPIGATFNDFEEDQAQVATIWKRAVELANKRMGERLMSVLAGANGNVSV
jgi:hypothetical protein